MANRPIRITGIDTDGSLILSDNGQTNVNPGDTVTWIIDQHSRVATITGIDNSGPDDVFAPNDPAPVGSSSSWRGTVNPQIPRNSEENYIINYTRTDGNESGSFDPKIQVNP